MSSWKRHNLWSKVMYGGSSISTNSFFCTRNSIVCHNKNKQVFLSPEEKLFMYFGILKPGTNVKYCYQPSRWFLSLKKKKRKKVLRIAWNDEWFIRIFGKIYTLSQRQIKFQTKKPNIIPRNINPKEYESQAEHLGLFYYIYSTRVKATYIYCKQSKSIKKFSFFQFSPFSILC